MNTTVEQSSPRCVFPFTDALANYIYKSNGSESGMHQSCSKRRVHSSVAWAGQLRHTMVRSVQLHVQLMENIIAINSTGRQPSFHSTSLTTPMKICLGMTFTATELVA